MCLFITISGLVLTKVIISFAGLVVPVPMLDMNLREKIHTVSRFIGWFLTALPYIIALNSFGSASSSLTGYRLHN